VCAASAVRQNVVRLPIIGIDGSLEYYGPNKKAIFFGPGSGSVKARAIASIRDDGSTLWRRARSDGSYASANDPRVLVGLGQSTHVPRIRVVWPGGTTEEWSGVPIDRYTTLKEGDAK